MIRMPRIVIHDPHMALIDGVAAEIHFEFHFLLKHHHELAGLAVCPIKLLRIVQAVDIFPAATSEWFKKRGPADIVEDRFPIERIS